jgi:PIN domain nuclease of toxin-antitoxin system
VGRSLLILLDTHIVLWLALEEERLSKNAKASIDQARKGELGLAISDFTLYELTLISRKKRLNLSISLETLLVEVVERFVVLPISKDVCLQTLAFPPGYPKDPADRIIGATAVVHGLELVTADQAIRKSGAVPTIW